MGFGIAPIDGVGRLQGSQSAQPLDTKSLISQFDDATRVIDNEVQGLNKQMLGIKDSPKSQIETDVKAQNTKSTTVHVPEQEALAGELSKETLLEKSKRKKSKWEEKMDEMAALEGQIAMDQLNGEEKSVFQEFFDNMAKIKQLRSKLKQLEKQEELIEEEKKKKRLEEMRNGGAPR